MENLLELSDKAARRAQEIIRETDIINIWQSVGAQPNLIGSASMGLIMKNKDLDFHIYSSPLRVADSFEAMNRLAQKPGIRQIQYGNLLDTEEECLEWHAIYEAQNGETWKMDMIHIVKGSKFDGHMERVRDRIKAILTPETRLTILQLKYDTPETEPIMGIEYYQAVLRDGIKTYAELVEWRKNNPANAVIEWMP
ncbi:phosphoglycerate mutase family protein [Dysgonomonas sp. 25]|uniref:phosphoglycerate mutase family protein n=1 Tax=Dysgonomonas sp. 25 TaxID=2302933 RepID=UPI0013CFB260|nr:phosphoglycerate mutase family protein [Dysgonomonas sp. 25]NDV69236.1 phosphoglycerate mutase family protein [Dysgonomonas sp. 25]